jgi:hypothetical protein
MVRWTQHPFGEHNRAIGTDFKVKKLSATTSTTLNGPESKLSVPRPYVIMKYGRSADEHQPVDQ